MANAFRPKRSSTASSVPTTSDLVDGEFAVNTADKKVYVRAGAAIVEVANASAGAVTSVDLSAPPDLFTVSGNPVTGAGTLTLTKASQSANLFYASPNLSSGAPTFRALGKNDYGAGTVFNNSLNNMPANTLKGNNIGIAADPADLTKAQVLALLGLSDSGWTTPTLGASWVSFAGGYAAPGYRKIGSVVYLRGHIKSGTITNGTTLFTLPSGYRPTASLWFLLSGGTGTGADIYNLQVNSAGAVQIYNLGASNFVTLTGLTFHVD